MLCIGVGLYDMDCVLTSDEYTAQLFRGLADGFSTPIFGYLGDFPPEAGGLACAGDDDAPPLGSAFMYQVQIVDGAGAPIPTCGT